MSVRRTDKIDGMDVVHSRFEPVTRFMLYPTGESRHGLPVLESQRTKQRYVLTGVEETTITRTQKASKGIILDSSPIRLPAPCGQCGSTNGYPVNELETGMAEGEESSGQGRIFIYRCTNGHAIRY